MQTQSTTPSTITDSRLIAIDSTRLMSELQMLASFTSIEPSSEGTAVTRIVFTPDDLRARAWLRTLAEDAGLGVQVDAVGNTFFRWIGSEPDLPAVATGSHIDAIPHAGMYDGTVGVLGGLEAIRALKRSGAHPRRSIELVLLTSEEPTRFGIGCIGSRLLAGTIAPDYADALHGAQRGSEDETLAQVRSAAGRSPACACRPTITMPGLNCTSNRVRCSSANTSRSASSPPSPRPPAIASPLKALADMLARS